MKGRKQWGKRSLAATLAFVMVSQIVMPIAKVSAEELESEEQFSSQLLQMSEQYPEGAFAFHEARISLEEGKEAELVIVRKGNRDKEAKVSLRVVDVSAKYGEDYTLTVKEGAFFSKTLEGIPGAETLMESQNQQEDETGINEEATEEAAPQEEVAPEEVEEEVQPKEEKADQVVTTEETPGEVKIDQEIEADKEFRTLKGKSGLQAARDAYLGEESERVDWTEVQHTEESYEQMEQLAQQEKASLEEFSKNIDGIKYDMTFRPGEYKKVITIKGLNDKISESEEQILFTLFQAEDAEIGDVATAYANMKDTNEIEDAVFEVAQSDIYVERNQEYVKIPIRRVQGENRHASVLVGTSEETAKVSEDYVSVKEELFFAQGITEQSIHVPLVQDSDTTGEVTFYVGIEGKGSKVSESRNAIRVHIVDPGQAKERLAQARSSQKNPSFTIDKEIWAKDGNTSTVQLDQKFELSTAQSITVNYQLSTNGRKWTTGKGCSKKKHESYDMEMKVMVGNVMQTVTASKQKTGSVEVSVEGNKSAQKSNAPVQISLKGTNGNNNAHAKITSIVVNYPGYRFKINNATSRSTSENSYSVYDEKQYYSNTSTEYNVGKKLILGDLLIEDLGSYVSEKTYYQPSSVTLSAMLNEDATTSMGVRISEENTKCKGVRLKKGEKVSDLIALSDVTFNRNFIDTYKEYLSDDNVFDVYPVFEPVKTSVYLAETEGNAYTYKRGAGKLLECTALDAVKVQAYTQSDAKSIETILASPIEKEGKAVAFTKDIAKKMAEKITNHETPTVSVNQKDQYVLGNTRADLLHPTTANSSEEAWVSAVTHLFVYAVTDMYTVKVQVDGSDSRNLEKVTTKSTDAQGNEIKEKTYKGAVAYTDGEEVQGGDPEHPLLISEVKKGENIKLSALTVQDVEGKEYKINWFERTGDKNGDGVIDTQEKNDLASYELMKPNAANLLNFNIRNKETLLMYSFEEINKNITGVLQGNVYVKANEIFTGTQKNMTLEGATVMADDQSTVTGTNLEKGTGIKSDGYYYLERQGWSATDYLYVNVIHNGVTYSFMQNPGIAEEVYLDVTKPIYVKDGSAHIYDGEGNRIGVQDMTNGDHEYTLEVTAGSTDTSIVPKKAKLKFYNKSGELKKEIEVDQTAMEVENHDGKKEEITDTGVFRFTFNPSKLALEAGTTLTLQFKDQNGLAYYEHPTGICFKQSMGLVSFVNSMAISADTGSILGAIDTAFDFGWTGNFDSGEYVTNETVVTGTYETVDKNGTTTEVQKTQQMKTICFGYDLDEDRVMENDYKKPLSGLQADAVNLADKDQKVVEAKEELRNMKKDGASEADIAKKEKEIQEKQKEVTQAKQKYDETVKENNEKQKTKVNLALNASVDVGFSLAIRTIYDEEAQQWYYYDMLLAVDLAAGVTTEFIFTTPVGLDVILTVAVGLDNADTVVTVSQRDGNYYYIQTPEGGSDTDDVKIHIFDADMNDADRQFDYNGAFHIAPSIKLTGEAGSHLLSTTVGADVSALFDLYYYTNPNLKDTQVLKINGGLFVKIFGFVQRWDLGTGEIDLGGSSKARSRELLEAMTLESALYDPIDDMGLDSREYLENRSEWDQSNVRARAMSTFQEQVLMSGVYQYPDVQFADLGNGAVLAVYVDAVPGRTAVNNTAVYYTVYNRDGSQTWTVPVMIEDDGTLDDTPVVADLGDKGVMVAWSTADQVFGEEADVIDVLASRNIHTALFNKNTYTFAQVQEATKTTDEDMTGDVQPSITYYKTDSGEERMLMYYSKNEYTRTQKDGVLGDALNPYSVMAYMYYDFENECWRQYYTEEEKEAIISGGGADATTIEDYEEDWYGQGFLSMAPVVSIEETLNESGYWTQEPTVTEINTQGVQPIVVEGDMITYEGLGLFAYVADQDANLQTEADRDIYMQIYDYQDDTFTHPIMITGDNKQDSHVKFARIGGDTYLAWISDQKIQVMNVSVALRDNCYIKGTTESGENYYYFNKWEGGGYEAPHQVAAYENEPEVIEQGNAAAGKAIHNFDIQANEEYIYVLWTESENVLKDGIEPGSLEAENPENYVKEQQIYGSKMDVDTGSWSGRVKISDVDGANYGDLDFTVKEDGSLLIMAQKSMSRQINSEGYTFSMEDEKDSSLVSMSVMPGADVKITDLTMENPKEGETVTGSVEIANEGFENADELTVQVKDEKGNVLLEEKLDQLESGKNETYSFAYELPKTNHGKTTWKVKAEVLCDGEMVSDREQIGTVQSQLSITEFDVIQDETREQAEVRVQVANQSAVTTPKEQIQILFKEKELTTLEVPALEPGEEVTVAEEIQVKDEMFTKGEDKNASKTETLELIAKGSSNTMQSALVRTTPKGIWENFQSITKATADSVSVKAGEYATVEAEIQSDIFQYDEYTTYENYGVDVIWSVEDPSIAKVTENGTVKGLKKGTTTVKGMVMPAPYIMYFNDSGEGVGISSYLTLTSDMFEVIETEITVTDKSTKTQKSTKLDENINLFEHTEEGNENLTEETGKSKTLKSIKDSSKWKSLDSLMKSEVHMGLPVIIFLFVLGGMAGVMVVRKNGFLKKRKGG